MIVGGFPKLSETFILRHITGLIDLGHQVDIYARRNPREDLAQPDVGQYRLLERTHYFEIPAGARCPADPGPAHVSARPAPPSPRDASRRESAAVS